MPCFACGSAEAEPERAFPGLRGDDEALRAAVCSPACAEEVRRFAARRAVQLAPARAGTLVATLGVVTAAVFLATGRDLGRALLVLAIFGAGTTRLAYPDVVPLALGRAVGLGRAQLLSQWLGVLMALAAVVLAAVFLFVGR